MNEEKKKYHIFLVKNTIITFILVLSLIAAVQTPSVNAQNTKSKTNVLGVAPQSAALLEQKPPNLKPSANFTKASFVQAGIGLRNVGSGHITLDVPTSATILKAYLYWTHLGLPSNKIYLDGEQITGNLIASDQDPCWGQGKIFVHSADVTNTLLRRGGPIGDQYISVESGDVTSRSPWDSTPSRPVAESAHLLIVYRDISVPSGNVIIYQANGSPITFLGGTTSFTANFPPHTSNQAYVGYALADGQIFGAQQPKSFVWTTNTPTTLASGQIYGRDPSITSKASVRGSLSDTQAYDVSGNTPSGISSAHLGWNFSSDCLTIIYGVVQI
jgi:hypothetical protein